ncbi:MAG TPA: phosphohistidine phosphatase SixA [Gemmataceae bacterium]|nr:phosphohistidine phosphatase SixA [Gemmataceae bacterium]
MDVYLIRHADAAPLGEAGATEDFDRPLNDAGRDQSKKLAQALSKRGVHIDRLLVSPLVRAQQTAEPLVTAWGLAPDDVVTCKALAPGGKCRKVAEWVNERPVAAVGLVGHRPDLNELAAWLIGSKRAKIALDKAGVGLIRVDDSELEKGSGELVWLLPEAWV